MHIMQPCDRRRPHRGRAVQLRKRRLMEHGLLIRHRKGNLQYKRLRPRKWERFQKLPPDETDVRTRLPGQQPGNTRKPKRPRTRRPPA